MALKKAILRYRKKTINDIYHIMHILQFFSGMNLPLIHYYENQFYYYQLLNSNDFLLLL